MKHLMQRLMGLIGLLVVILFAFSGIAQAAGTGWSVFSSPNPTTNSNSLQAVAAISTNKVWAVGYSVYGTQKNNVVKRTLIEQFNGTNWHVVTSPNVGTGDNVLNGVSAISSTNAYAVGYSSQGALVLHFNGAGWHVVSAPRACLFNAVTAISATDVLAVGTMSQQPCAEHFDGISWSLMSTPIMGADDTLLGVSASSASNAWAVGTYCVGTVCDRGGGNFKTQILHYDGARWSVVSSPSPSSYVNQLSAVTVISANDAWAVGGDMTNPMTGSTLILHYDGISWSQVVSPSVNGSSSLTGIAFASATDIFAVGSASSLTVVEHFDGTSWSIVSSPSPGMYNALNAVAHVPHAALGNAQFWAVGAYNNNSPGLTLTERDI